MSVLNPFLIDSRFRETVGRKVVKALKREDDGITYAAVEFLNSLMQVCLVLILVDGFYG